MTFVSARRIWRFLAPLACAVAVLLSAAAGEGRAATPHRVERGAAWSADRLQGARPKSMPERSADGRGNLGPLGVTGSGDGAPARSPKVDPGTELDVHLYEPGPSRRGRASPVDEPALRPEAFGSTGAPFSQSRVFPNGAVRGFPFRAIGKLFAYDPVLDFDISCSAAVVQRRLIVTAGHCVFDLHRRRGYFLENLLFIPAFDRGRAPFGSWAIDRVWVAPSWLDGDGRLPNRADYAILSVQDQRVGGARTSIGDVVGWLGWREPLEVGHAALIGYPGNLDRGERMQITHAEVFAEVEPNSIEFGSAQGNGASGGPIVEDLGKPANGQRGGSNRMISVISFGVDEEGTLGGSRLGAEFRELLDDACAARPGSCE